MSEVRNERELPVAVGLGLRVDNTKAIPFAVNF